MASDFTTRTNCEGTFPRRAFLRASLTGLSTLGLADLLRLEARAGKAATSSDDSGAGAVDDRRLALGRPEPHGDV